MGSWSRFFLLSVFLFLLVPISFSPIGAVDEEVVALELADAEEALDLAYGAVIKAEEAGANVSGLVVRLNVGGEYLAEAYVWYRLEVFENASHFAGFCREVIGSVGDEAIALRDEAKRLAREHVLNTVIGSAVGEVVVVISSFLIWGVLRRRYRRRLLRFRPEVVSGES